MRLLSFKRNHWTAFTLALVAVMSPHALLAGNRVEEEQGIERTPPAVFEDAVKAEETFDDPIEAWISESENWFRTDESMLDSDVRKAQSQIPQAPLRPDASVFRPTPPSEVFSNAANLVRRDRVGSFRAPTSRSRSRRSTRNAVSALEIISGFEAGFRVTTDSGDLVRKSARALATETSKRAANTTHARVRGLRPGQNGASGSYWVPARMDLDTMLSKVDSRIVNDIVVVKGPYSALYGPGFGFFDIDLLDSPRFHGEFELHGQSTAEYKSNGEQWYGRQSISGGNSLWGFRVGYGHRLGSDYSTGNGDSIPSSFNSRDFDVAVGRELSDDSSIEMDILRLDQTDVEFPGQAFDLDFLVTDAIDITYTIENTQLADQIQLDSWYNRTRFAGNAQRLGKRLQFPFLNDIGYSATTDVDSLSTGYQTSATWSDVGSGSLTVGTDLRYVRQELNEISSGRIGFNVWSDRNSPIPRSYASNPGLFAQYEKSLREDVLLTTGSRVDWVATDIIDEPSKLAEIGILNPASTFADVVGTDRRERDFFLFSGFGVLEHRISECATSFCSTGYAERAPTLTELYAAQPFMFLLQNGLNTVTGDPLLDKERLWQIDAGIKFDNGRFSTGISAFHSWIWNYITYENIGTVSGPPFGQIEQVNLKFVNTDLATISGAEFYAENLHSAWFSSFATASFLEGRDHSRSGSFATRPAGFFSASERVAGLPRGDFSGVAGSPEEPLPNIRPFESRLGIRIHDFTRQIWNVELAARFVDQQDRIATSVLETETRGFVVFDLRTFWQASDRVLLLAGIENFTDEAYGEYLDFRPNDSRSAALRVLQPGSNFYFSTQVTF